MAVTMTILFFWVLMPCRLVDRYQRSEKNTLSIFSPEDGPEDVSPKRWYLPRNLHGVTTQNKTINTNASCLQNSK
jgi:hypothetical protein